MVMTDLSFLAVLRNESCMFCVGLLSIGHSRFQIKQLKQPEKQKHRLPVPWEANQTLVRQGSWHPRTANTIRPAPRNFNLDARLRRIDPRWRAEWAVSGERFGPGTGKPANDFCTQGMSTAINAHIIARHGRTGV